MSEYAKILGHEPTTATVALIHRIDNYIERTHAAHPEIPVNILWDDLQSDLEAIIQQRAEG